jgi:CubicO group peptidase (beta-lactamase class C family)
MRPFTIVPTLLLSVAQTSALSTRQASNSTLEGFTKDGLLTMNAAMHKWVDDNQGANVVTLISRHGKIVDHDAYGVLDIKATTKTPVQKDTIFRIMSMTKPIVGVAMMMFYEEGKWKLDDPVSKHIPDFAKLQVKTNCVSLAKGSVPAKGSFPVKGGLLAKTNCTLVPPKTQMNMAQLMSHSAGFPGGLSIPSTTLGGIIEPLKGDNLAFQPGKDWQYGPGVDIQGYLVQKWAGKDLSDFLQDKLLVPLSMVDTGFFINASKTNRVTRVHSKPKNGSLISHPPVAMFGVDTTKPAYLRPSSGLYSTAEDYWKFCQMLLNGGEFNGRRYLKADTVKLMHTNVLEPQVKVSLGGSTGEGIGFGLDFAMVLDQAASQNNMPKDSFYWGGAYGSWFWIDPVNDVAFVGMIQNVGAEMFGPKSVRQISAKAAYAALRR